MKNNMLSLLVVLLLLGCTNGTTDKASLNDELIDQQSKYYTLYYSASDINEAEKALRSLIPVAKNLGGKGAKSEVVLWDACFRMADLKAIEGQQKESEAFVQDATGYFAKLKQFYSDPNENKRDLMISLLKSVDLQKGPPEWKKNRNGGLF